MIGDAGAVAVLGMVTEKQRLSAGSPTPIGLDSATELD